MDTTTMSRSLDKLEKSGYLVRERDPDCRRSFLICLTKAGREEAAQVHQGFDRLNDVICEGMDPEEQELLKNLERILKNLKECPGALMLRHSFISPLFDPFHSVLYDLFIP